jgi:hypothetical protein
MLGDTRFRNRPSGAFLVFAVRFDVDGPSAHFLFRGFCEVVLESA